MDKNVIIDGNNLYQRANHTTSHLTLSNGMPCGAAYGFLAILLTSLKRVIGPDDTLEGIHVAWDYGCSPRRLSVYPEYKAQRRAVREEIKENDPRAHQLGKHIFSTQMEIIKSYSEPLGMLWYQKEGVEADDLIAYLCHNVDNPYIISNDKDFLQLQDYAKILLKEDIIEGTEEEAIKDLARHIIVGDVSDNIKGVPGIGGKSFDVVWEFITTKHGACEYGLEMFINSAPQKDYPKKVNKCLENHAIMHRNMAICNLRDSMEYEDVLETIATADRTEVDIPQFQRIMSKLKWKIRDAFVSGLQIIEESASHA